MAFRAIFQAGQAGKRAVGPLTVAGSTYQPGFFKMGGMTEGHGLFLAGIQQVGKNTPPGRQGQGKAQKQRQGFRPRPTRPKGAARARFGFSGGRVFAHAGSGGGLLCKV